MKIKLLVIVTALGMPMYFSAQTKVFLYNEGVMSVKGTDATSTTLYIKGDLKTGGSNATSHCDITLSNSKTVLTGDFIHNDQADDAVVFRNTATADKSIFRFAGNVAQNIMSDGKTFATIPSKKTSYINFPILMIDNDLSAATTKEARDGGAVLVDPAMAIKAKSINANTGWLVLESEIIVKGNTALENKYLSSSVGLEKRTALAHLMLDPQVGTITYGNKNATNYWNRGFVQVDLALRTEDEAKETGYERALTGLGSPFKGMYSDYFMWNFLFAPSQANLFGPNGTNISDPSTVLVPGQGYLLGIDLRGSKYDAYSWSVEYPGLDQDKFNARTKEEYKFNRSLYANSQTTTNNYFGENVSDKAYTQEILNGQEDVKIDLTVGYNYLANPYTSPLNITPLLTAAGSVPAWGVISGSQTTTDRQIMNRVWVLNNNSSTGKGFAEKGNREVTLQLNYYLAKKSGSTYPQNDQYKDGVGDPNMVIIPPLQMFLVYAYKACTITIPRSAQEMGATTFMRSSVTPFNEMTDDFVFEVLDKKTGASDRVSVVLRSNKEILEDVEYSNVVKIKALSTANDNAVALTQDEDGLGNGFSSLIYTKSDNNKLLISNYIPYSNYQSSVSTTLYLQPSKTEQEVTINALRLQSLKEFEEVIIKDKLTGISKVLTPTDYSFETTTKPTDSADRFTLIFKRNTTGIEDEIDNNSVSKSISSYYNSGVLTVTGFDESDFGSSLSIYDIQGRLIKKASVNDFTVSVSHPFISGAYIVKVVGNSSYISKFLAK